MEKQHLEVVIVSSKSSICCKRPADNLEECQPVYKRPRRNSSVCPMDWEASLPPESSRCSYSNKEVFVTSSLISTAQPRSLYQCKKPPRKAPYDPFDFTSDELNPAYEWLTDSSSARKCKMSVRTKQKTDVPEHQGGTDIFPVLRSTLSPFPLGLRLDKLEAIVWGKHRVHLLKLSLEHGYRDSLQFLQAMPGIILKFPRKKASRCLVLLDPACKISH